MPPSPGRCWCGPSWSESTPERPLFYLALALVGIGVPVLLAEGVARLRWEAPWYERLLTEQKGWRRPHHRLNRLGLRGPEVRVPKPDGTQRVLVLGDSFTYGLGVDDERVPFPAVLQRRLNAARPDETSRYEVVNGGLPGSLTGQWLGLWRRIADEVEPDVVLAVFFLRDGTRDTTVSEIFDVIRAEIAERNAESSLYQASYLYRWVRDLQDRARAAEAYTQTLLDGYFGGAEETQQWEKAQRHLLLLRQLVEARGAVFGLVVFPVLVELDAGHPFRPISDRLMSFAAENGIAALDLLPAFEGNEAPDLWVSALDQHPNRRGHAIAAASIEPFLRDLLAKAAN